MFDERPVRADTAETQADRQTPLQIHIYEPMCRRGRRRKQLAHAARPLARPSAADFRRDTMMDVQRFCGFLRW